MLNDELIMSNGERFLVVQKKTGLGSDMITLIGASVYARNTQRTLVIDWRRSLYSKDKTVNAFPRFFNKIGDIDGVKVICDDSVCEITYPEPVNQLHSLKIGDYFHLLQTNTDVQAPTVLNTRPMHLLPSLEIQQRVLAKLKLHDDVQRQVNVFRQAEFEGSAVVGVHFRHGNGEKLGCARSKLSLQECCSRISKACQSLAVRLQALTRLQCRIFVCTDSSEAEQLLKARLPNVVTRPKLFRKPNAGALHFSSLGIAEGQNALIEMFLLSHCNTLVYNNSWFSYYARIMGHFEIEPISITPANTYGTPARAIKRLHKLYRPSINSGFGINVN